MFDVGIAILFRLLDGLLVMVAAGSLGLLAIGIGGAVWNDFYGAGGKSRRWTVFAIGAFIGVLMALGRMASWT